jgi:hypothetical protein
MMAPMTRPDIPVDQDEIDRLLAIWPSPGPFAADGLTLSEALVDQTLGPFLNGLPDRIYWSMGTPDESGAEGIETYLLRHTFAYAGHPIRSMPPIRELAETIRTRAMNKRGDRITAIWRECQGPLSHHLAPLMVGETLHATDVLNNNFEIIRKFLLAAYKKYVPKDLDESDREDFFRCVIARVIGAARRFDPSRGAEFSTYAYRFIDGAARDWRAAYFGINLKTGERHVGRSKNISIDTSIGLDDEGEPLTVGDTLADPDSIPEPERPSFAEIANSPLLTTKQRDFLIGWTTHGGTLANYARSRSVEPNAARQMLHRIKNKS